MIPHADVLWFTHGDGKMTIRPSSLDAKAFFGPDDIVCGVLRGRTSLLYTFKRRYPTASIIELLEDDPLKPKQYTKPSHQRRVAIGLETQDRARPGG